MVVINEWLPNPSGNDTEGEWIELWNNNESSIDLTGWKIETSNGSSFSLSGDLGSYQYALLLRKNTKLVLRNRNEVLRLLDGKGALRHVSALKGDAHDGRSFSLSEHGVFSWTTPTPGKVNAKGPEILLAQSYYPTQSTHAFLLPFLSAVGVGVCCVIVFLIIIKRNYALSELFFKRG